MSQSRPARGAWIETGFMRAIYVPNLSRPARGAWIETVEAKQVGDREGRAPRGARGLKPVTSTRLLCVFPVAPRAGRVD